MTKAVFLDLNGTLVLPVQPERLADLEMIDGIAGAIAKLNELGFVCPVVTVQSRIAKGRFSASEFSAWFDSFARRLRAVGAEVVGPYVCPHRFSESCACKKPSTLLYEQAAADYEIDLGASWVVGDTAADLEAAARFKGRSALVRTGWGGFPDNIAAATALGARVADSLVDAVELINADDARTP